MKAQMMMVLMISVLAFGCEEIADIGKKDSKPSAADENGRNNNSGDDVRDGTEGSKPTKTDGENSNGINGTWIAPAETGQDFDVQLQFRFEEDKLHLKNTCRYPGQGVQPLEVEVTVPIRFDRNRLYVLGSAWRNRSHNGNRCSVEVSPTDADGIQFDLRGDRLTLYDTEDTLVLTRQ